MQHAHAIRRVPTTIQNPSIGIQFPTRAGFYFILFIFEVKLVSNWFTRYRMISSVFHQTESVCIINAGYGTSICWWYRQKIVDVGERKNMFQNVVFLGVFQTYYVRPLWCCSGNWKQQISLLQGLRKNNPSQMFKIDCTSTSFFLFLQPFVSRRSSSNRGFRAASHPSGFSQSERQNITNKITREKVAAMFVP